jgi:hypothetical protein
VELADARRAFGDALDKLAEALADPESASIAARKTEAETLRKALLPHLQAAARWAEPGALRPFTLIEALADRLGLDLSLRSLEERLKGRIATLSAALSQTSSAAASLAEARAQRAALVSALQRVLDGDGFVVLPPVPIASETKPLLTAPSAPGVAPTLKSWSLVRERVAAAVQLAALTPGAKAYPVHEDATRDDPDPGDPGAGDASLVPRSFHFGTFIADSDPATAGNVAGFVIDEWADQVPSERQMGGLAINYDSPQAEAPNCLLLCVPPEPSPEGWTSQAGAEMVREAIAWMRARALTTTDKLGPGAMLPNGNQVAPKPRAQGGLQRIPKQLGGFIVGAWHQSDGAFVGVAAAVARKAKINERTRFGGAEN